MTTTVRPVSVRLKIGADRAIRYTPAVTMVAAWIRAETGVGPSIAAGRAVWSGNCADVPQGRRRARGGALHRVGRPGLQRELPGLATGAEQQHQGDRGDHAVGQAVDPGE